MVALPGASAVVGSGTLRAGMGSSAELIDAAMALRWIDSQTHEEAIFVTELATLEAADAVNVQSAGLTLAASISSEVDLVSSSSDQIEDHDEPWLAEALLERVFG